MIMFIHLRRFKVLMLLTATAQIVDSQSPAELERATNEEKLEKLAEDKHEFLHKVDSINLMVYTSLLILTVLTVWLFKQRRFRFVHETGLTMIFGLIVGLLIKLTTRSSKQKTVLVVPAPESQNMSLSEPPDSIRLGFPFANQSGTFSYKFYGEVMSGDAFEEIATFDPEVFMNVLLPPIIFYAGYSLKRKHFFRNIGTIMAFALIGTTVSCIVVGLVMWGISQTLTIHFDITQCLFFGALISATDPVTVLAIFSDLQVDVDLFALVFGEAALNDAVAIVLTRTIERYMPANGAVSFGVLSFFESLGLFFGIFFGSFALGSLVGCFTALLTKFTRIRDFPTLETALFFLMSYLSFLMAEAAGMTGIVAILFCGVAQAHYTYNNLSEESKVRTKQFFELLNFLSENFVFTYIGVSMFTSQAHIFDAGFIAGSFFAILLGRAVFVYTLSFILNCARKPKIPTKFMHMLLFAGLRGAIAFALAIRNTADPQRRVIYTTTSLIVIATVLFNGGLATQLFFYYRVGVDDEQETIPQFQPNPEQPTEETGANPTNQRGAYNPWDKAFLPRKWYNFDSMIMKPLLTHKRPSLIETCPSCCYGLARMLTTTEQLSQRDYHSQNEADLVIDASSVTTHHDPFAPPTVTANNRGGPLSQI